ncbi:MAG: hypothetical protein ACI9ES_001779 [Oceanospirillaceae bacterium]
MKIKRFISQNENGLIIQALIALIAYLLLKLKHLTYLSDQTLYQVRLLFGTNLMDRRSIMELLKSIVKPLKPDKNGVEQKNFELLKA